MRSIKKQQNFSKFKFIRNALNNLRLYAFLLTLTLCLVLFTSAVSSYSQSPTPTPRLVIEQKVRELAKCDVKKDIPRRYDFAVKLYSKKSPDLKDDEILEIYDNEYTKQLEAKKNNLWEQLKQKSGGLFAIFWFLAFIFKDFLKLRFSKICDFLENQICNKLLGTPLLRGAALKRYRKELKDKYEKLKISFRLERPLKLKDIYVPLKVTGTDDNDFIDAFQAVAKYRRIMVKGPPGSGKTMLLKYIALCYAEGRWADLFNKFQCIPILVELHRFSNTELTVEQQLVKALGRDGFPNAESFVSQSLDKNKLLLLLDGLDEVSSNERQRVVTLINEFLDTHQKCPVIITCRTAVYRGEFNDYIDQTLEVVEFNDQQIREFLVPWKQDIPPGKSVEQLIQTLHDRPRIMALARNPLMLTIIAHLYADTPFVLPHSRAEFYRKATEYLLEQWHQERNQFQARDKKQILQHLALFFQDNANQLGQDRRSVDWRTVESEVINILPDLNLQPDCTRPILLEIVERSSLLLAIDGGERYQFAHLTLQEFFAACQLREDVDGLVSRFKADPDTWRETLKLWCGLAGDSTNLIREVRTVNSVVAFECLADIQKVDSTLALEIINSFKSQLGICENEDVVNHAFASVAADERRRIDVFRFLKETVEDTSETDTRRKAAANALSLTNLSSAAEVIAKQYINLNKIEFRQILDQALIRMGDIAVLEIEKVVTTDSVYQVMDVLVSIGTPSALQTLVNWLWNRNKNVSLRAALLLTSVLQQEKNEITLRNCQLPQGYSQQKSFDWIWQPFKELADSNLPIITGQIAYLISKNLGLSIFDEAINKLSVHQFDYRILIPLCLIQAETQIKSVFSQRMPNKQLPKFNIQNFKQNQNYYKQWFLDFLDNNAFTLWGFLLLSLSPIICFFLYYSRDYFIKELQRGWTNEAWNSSLKRVVSDYPIIKKSQVSKIFKKGQKSFYIRKCPWLSKMLLKIFLQKQIEEYIKNEMAKLKQKDNSICISLKIRSYLLLYESFIVIIFEGFMIIGIIFDFGFRLFFWLLFFIALLYFLYIFFVLPENSRALLIVTIIFTLILSEIREIGEREIEWFWEWEEWSGGMSLEDFKKLARPHII